MLLNYENSMEFDIIKKTVEFFTKGGAYVLAARGFMEKLGDLQGYTYNNLMRIMKRPEMSFTLAEEGNMVGWLV